MFGEKQFFSQGLNGRRVLLVGFADEDRRIGVRPTVDKVLELMGVGGDGGGGGGDYGSSKPAEATSTPGDNGQTAEVTQNPVAGSEAPDKPSYGGEEVSGCKVTLPARSSCCSCDVRDFCG